MEAHARGEHVLVEFTASWCMNCQYNKRLVLSSADVIQLANRKGVTLFTADLTSDSPAANSLLEHLGSRSIPFLALFPGDDPYSPVVMRDVLRKKQVVDMLSKLPDK